MSHTRISLLATTLVLAVLTAACGGGTESANDADTTLASSRPVVSAISLGSTQPEVDRESAANAWSELTAGLTEGSFVAPFESDGSLYALMESSALAPPPFDERFAVMEWDGENWVAVSGTQGPSCFPGSECYLDVDFCAIAVRQVYRTSKDYEKVVMFLETLYASNRLKLPLTGLVIIGY